MMKLPLHHSILSGLLLLPAGAVLAQAPVSSTQQQPTGTIEQRVERLERMLQSQGLLEIVQQLQRLERDINMLRGEIETHNYNLDQLSNRQRNLYADIDQRLQRLEGGTGTSAPLDMTAGAAAPAGEAPPLETLSGVTGNTGPGSMQPGQGGLQFEVITNPGAQQTTPPPGSTGADPATTAAGQSGPNAGAGPMASTAPSPQAQPVSADPVQLQAEYQQAFNLLRQSLYDQAIKAFQQFLTDHPNDRYSDSAQYWLAETYYVKREFQPALDEYNKLVAHFPESQKAGDAMLKIGFTLIELGQLDDARAQLQELIRQQPDTTVARLADEKLKQLGSTPQPSLPAEVN